MLDFRKYRAPGRILKWLNLDKGGRIMIENTNCRPETGIDLHNLPLS